MRKPERFQTSRRLHRRPSLSDRCLDAPADLAIHRALSKRVQFETCLAPPFRAALHDSLRFSPTSIKQRALRHIAWMEGLPVAWNRFIKLSARSVFLRSGFSAAPRLPLVQRNQIIGLLRPDVNMDSQRFLEIFASYFAIRKKSLNRI